MKVSIDQIEKSRKRYDSWEQTKARSIFETPDTDEFLEETDTSVSPELVRGNIIGDIDNLNKRRQMLMTSGVEPVDFALERAIGKNDSVYSNFIELIGEAKSKVGRIIIKEGTDVVGYATGFMVSESLLLTNWHVFREKDEATDSAVQFFYELDSKGNPVESVTFRLAPNTFFYSFQDLDYCLVAVESTDLAGRHNLAEIGYLYLDPTLGKLGNENQELLNIIHHPDGDFKQLSIRENKFVRIMPTTLWYESDTSQGSSGSPVFNDQWQIVALHHMGIASKDGQGNYLDKDGKVIPVDNGKIDIARVHWVANEGIRISVIRNHIQTQFPGSPIVAKMINPPTAGVSGLMRPLSSPSRETLTTLLPDKSIQITIPSEVVERQRAINVNITTSDFIGSSGSTFSGGLTPADTLAEESLKLERTIDFSGCDGYESDFLGDQFRVAIPKPNKKIRNHVAKLNGSRAYILRYYKYSVIHNALKKMPIISAINVDGDPDKRRDETKRKDVWIRDRRIDLDTQLNNDFYSNSGFDRGHMSRREDANWGETPEEAKRNADLTCMQTNACPQVPTLNRSSRKGVWGKLEKIILEEGAVEEQGKTGKISVFSGPIFKDTDPIFRGVKIPMEFYKVVLWISDDHKLKATAFKLSQSDLVDEIDFEEIGIDQDIAFKEYQCSIKSLEKVTNIDFSDIVGFDTFSGTTDVEISNEESLRKVIKGNKA